MANTITGRILSIGQPQQVATGDPNRPVLKRELLMDCTRHNVWTGERDQYENTPLLEFTGEKAVAELNRFREGDVVTVSFDIHGVKYIDKKTQIEKVFTRIRPYKVDKVEFKQPVQRPQTQGVSQPAQPVTCPNPATPPTQESIPYPPPPPPQPSDLPF